MKDKNELIELTPEQQNPGAALPEDFEVVRHDGDVFTGQRSDAILDESDKECYREFTGTPRSVEPGDAEPPRNNFKKA
jgi:hypothetical protein